MHTAKGMAMQKAAMRKRNGIWGLVSYGSMSSSRVYLRNEAQHR